MIVTQTPTTRSRVNEYLTSGSRFIAPLWPLENFVAVNAYMGLADTPFHEAMNFLNKSAGTEGTLSTSFYLEALRKGGLTKDDIAQALDTNKLGIVSDEDDFLFNLREDSSAQTWKIRTLADVASEINGKKKKWSRFMIDRVSFWASAYFDNKQATWDTAKNDRSIFKAWKREAEVDLGTEVMGLKGFRNLVSILPDNYLDAVAIALNELEIPEEMMDHYLNSLLMKINGWAGFAARIDWDARLAGEESHALHEMLAIMVVWEMSLKKLLKYSNLESSWDRCKNEVLSIIASNNVDEELAQRLILQEAFDLANQRKIIQKINSQKSVDLKKKLDTKYQAVFCIDVRSEVYRRNMESITEDVETIGFAGFFGFPVEYVPLGHEHGDNQCPVLLNTSHTVKESVLGPADEKAIIQKRTLKKQMLKAWKSFKQGAISCFGFVSPLGIFFLPKLLSDSFGRTRPLPLPNNFGLHKQEVEKKSVELAQTEAVGIPLEDRVKMAKSALTAMSLTENFAPVVLIVGHGSTTTNNPHGSGLDCGACGGNSGEANAKVAAAILNDPEVRELVKNEGIEIPEDTLFMPALHDTTTDEVKLFDAFLDDKETYHSGYINDLKYILQLAGEKTRAERGERMNVASEDVQKKVIERSRDWSQVRPEWGLAGCSSFVVAPRERTSQLNLEGKTFMHNYSWQKDKDFGVLELIMTAPMVVTSWINLQYYASTVDNKLFGSGNKTLHNVVGGLGVLEGFAGDLRVGLPWQSVHDGEKFQHEPQRLNVIIEAPVDEMSKILEKHESIRDLCDNQWIFLFAINQEGKVAYKYIGDLQWEVI